MSALRDLQAALLHDIYSGERTSAVYLADGVAGSPERLDIYVNNTLFALTDVLAGAYPVLQQIVGAEFFKTIARYYIRTHPQPAGNRHEFGAELGAFLRSFEPAAALPYLGDMAALEWAYFQAGIADDTRVLDINELAQLISIEPDFALRLHHSVRLVNLSFNVFEIWQAHQKDEIGTLTLSATAQTIAVWRNPADEILLKSLSRPLARLLASCQKGQSFAEAMASTAEGLADLQSFQQEFAESLALGIFSQDQDKEHD